MLLLKEFLWIQSSLFQEESVLHVCYRTGLKPSLISSEAFLWPFHTCLMSAEIFA